MVKEIDNKNTLTTLGSLSLKSRPIHPHITIPEKFWHSRDYLPHFDQPGLIQSINFRLVDSVPAVLIDEWRTELSLHGSESAADPRMLELFQRIEKYSDLGRGECWLRNPEIAELVENAMMYFDGQRYRLLAWCVMPNHVHSLIETFKGHPLGSVLHSWKSYTSNEANKRLIREGQFWMREYFDRYIRNWNHLTTVINYIEQNPVKAGLCQRAEDWPWSSARRRKEG